MSTPYEFRAGQDSFDPERIQAMSLAFIWAWKIIEETGSLLATAPRAEATRDALAKRIIELTLKGERDPVRLCEQTLGLKQSQ